MYKDITELYVFVDDFCKAVDQYQAQTAIQNQTKRKPTRVSEMRVSDILTIMILFQQSSIKNFKHFYYIFLNLYQKEFPHLVSYKRFVDLQKRCLFHLQLLHIWFCLRNSGGNFHVVDATKIEVCHNKRIASHKVFKDSAKRGKSSMGWFYGFKLHLVINAKGEIQSALLTAGNVDDRVHVDELTKRLKGLLFGDKGYIKQPLFEQLYKRGLKLITPIKEKMKNKLMITKEKNLLKKRSIIETVIDVLKNKMMLQHTRHRSVLNFMVHILSTLVAYALRVGKPRVRFEGL